MSCPVAIPNSTTPGQLGPKPLCRLTQAHPLKSKQCTRIAAAGTRSPNLLPMAFQCGSGLTILSEGREKPLWPARLSRRVAAPTGAAGQSSHCVASPRDASRRVIAVRIAEAVDACSYASPPSTTRRVLARIGFRRSRMRTHAEHRS